MYKKLLFSGLPQRKKHGSICQLLQHLRGEVSFQSIYQICYFFICYKISHYSYSRVISHLGFDLDFFHNCKLSIFHLPIALFAKISTPQGVCQCIEKIIDITVIDTGYLSSLHILVISHI